MNPKQRTVDDVEFYESTQLQDNYRFLKDDSELKDESMSFDDFEDFLDYDDLAYEVDDLGIQTDSLPFDDPEWFGKNI